MQKGSRIIEVKHLNRAGLPVSTTTFLADAWHKWVPERVKRRKPILVDLFPTTYQKYTRVFAPVRGRYQNYTNLFGKEGVLAYYGNTQSALDVAFLETSPQGAVIPRTDLTARSIAEASLLKQVRSSKLNAAVALAEGKETLSFLASTAVSISKAVNAIKVGKGKQFAKIVNPRLTPTKRLSAAQIRRFNSISAERRWLEYNFAIMPLVDDAQGAAEAVADVWTPKLSLHFAYASCKTEEGIDFVGGTGTIQSGFKIRQTGIAKRRYSTCVWYVVYNEELQRLSQLGFTNPTATAYAAGRLTFVLDWLIPVGQFLEGWDAALGCGLKAAYQNNFLSAYVDWNLERVKPSDVVAAWQSASGYETYRGLVRRNTNVFPYPSLWIRNPLSSWTVATSAALIKQQNR